MEQLAILDRFTPKQIAVEYQALPKELRQAKTVIVWEGQSPICNCPRHAPMNGDRIGAVVSGLKGNSANDKTGAMAQASIILLDVHPNEAINTGQDVAICGGCPLRKQETGKRICYVNVLFTSGAKFRAQLASKYPIATPEQLGIILAYNGMGIRFGDYGDPAMVPYEVWSEILSWVNEKSTSYTHQWQEPWFDTRHFEYSMASIDEVNTVEKLRELHGDLVRYYRLLIECPDCGEFHLLPNEIMCPSDPNNRKHGKRVIECADCGLCSGEKTTAKNIAIKEGN